MTVSAWIESLQKFDPAMEVIVRMDYAEGDALGMATKPTFTADAGCGETEILCIDLTDADEGVEEETQQQPDARVWVGLEAFRYPRLK